MSYILPILTPYRYPILAALSLLLIAEMALADVNLIPIEYGWAFGLLILLTIVAWTGIAVVIGVSAPIGGDAPQDVRKDAPKQRVPNIYVPDFSIDEPARGNEPKRRVHTIWILSPALFAMLVLLSILVANIFLGQFIMVWIGMVVIVGATANVELSKKTYLIMNVFPLLALTLTMLVVPAVYLSTQLSISLFIPLGALVVFLSTSLVIGAVLRRSVMVDRRRIVVAITALGISLSLFVPVMVFVAFLIALAESVETCLDCPGPAVALLLGMLIVVVLLYLPFSVALTILIGTMRRLNRNITVAGIGMAAMILVVGWFLSLNTM